MATPNARRVVDPKVLEVIEGLYFARPRSASRIYEELGQLAELKGRVLPPLYTVQRIVRSLAYKDDSEPWRMDPLADRAESAFLLGLAHGGEAGPGLTNAEAKWAAAIHGMSTRLPSRIVLLHARRHVAAELAGNTREADAELALVLELQRTAEDPGLFPSVEDGWSNYTMLRVAHEMLKKEGTSK